MNNRYILLFKNTLVVLFCLATSYVAAQPTITLTATNGTCSANGKIEVHTTGTVGAVLYAIKKTTDVNFQEQVSDSVFRNLTSGTYIVAVYDESNPGEYLSNQQVITNATPTQPQIDGSPTSGNLIITGCTPDGSISLKLKSGTGLSPFTYRLLGGVTSKPDIVTFSAVTIANFTELETGTYRVSVSDACENTITTSNISVTSKYNIAGADFNTADVSTTFSSLSGCDVLITMAVANIEIVDINGVTLFMRSGREVPSNTFMQTRIEYPANSGNFSAWGPLGIFVLPAADYVPTINTIRVQFKNPCNEADIVSTPVKTINYPIESRSGYCTPDVYLRTLGYKCGPINIKLVNKISPFTEYNFLWDDANASYTFSGLPSGAYEVYITTEGVTYKTNDIITTSTAPNASLTFDYNYPNARGCDFTTAAARFYGLQIGNTVPITYSIQSGPPGVVRDPVTSTAVSVTAWSDLPAGNYVFHINFGGCAAMTRSGKITPPYSGFEADELSYIQGSTCGQYNITGKGWYLNPDGSVYTGTGTYVAGFPVANRPYSVESGYAVTKSNTVFTLAKDVPPGTYTVRFQSSSHSQSSCNYEIRTITIPPNIPLAVDVPNSGGLVCENGKGTLHVAVVGGSGGTLKYQLKVKGTPDTTYTPEQSSPNFANLSPGEYHVKVIEYCGGSNSSVEQDLTLTVGANASQINILGSTCEKNTAILNLRVVGGATDIKWKHPDGTEIVTINDTLRNLSQIDSGKYVVTFNSGGCSWRDSVTLTVKPKPEFAFITDTVSCNPIDLKTLRLVSGDTVGLTMTYYNNAYQVVANPSAIETGIYHIVGTNISSCTDTSNINVIIYPTATEATIAANDTTVCTGTNVTLKAKPTNGINILNPIIRWYADTTSVAIPLHTGTIFPIGIQTTTITRDTIFYVSVSGDNYCENLPNDRKPVNLTIVQKPTVNITTTQDTNHVCHNSTIALKAEITGAYSWIGWYEPDSVNMNETPTSKYIPNPRITDVSYNPDFSEVGKTIKLHVRINNNACGYISDTIYLRIMPLPTSAGFGIVSQPINPQSVCMDTIYELKITSSNLGVLKNVSVRLNDNNASGIAINGAYIKQPYTTADWDTIALVNHNETGATLLVPDSISGGDSVLVRFRIAAECDFTSGSSVNFLLNAKSVCADSLAQQTLTSAKFNTDQDTTRMNNFDITGTFSTSTGTVTNIMTNNTGDTVTWRMQAIVHGTNPTDPDKEYMAFLIPSGLRPIEGSYTPIKNAAPIADTIETITDDFGIEYSFPIVGGLTEGDTIIAEIKFSVNESPCALYSEFYTEIIYSIDSIICGNDTCGSYYTRGGYYPELTVERYIFTNFVDSGIVVNNLWNGVIKIKAQTATYLGDTIFIDFYVDRDNSGTLSSGDTLSKTFSQLTVGVPAGTTLPLSFANVAYEPQKQLLAVARGETLCDTVILPIATLIGVDSLCQNDTTVYYTEQGMGNYKWNVLPDAITGATAGVTRIPLEGASSLSDYPYAARVIWKKPGNRTIWTQYTLPTNPPQELNTTYFSVQVNQRPAVKLTGSPDTTVCEGTQVELSHFFRDTTNLGTLFFYKKGENDSSIFLSNQSPFYVEPLDTTTYRVIAIADASGCGSFDTVDFKVNVNKMPQIVSINVAQQPNCGSSTGSIELSISGGSDSYEYSLNKGSTYTDLPANNVIPNLPVGDYQIYIKDKIRLGCSASISDPIKLSAGDNGLYAIATATKSTTCSSADGIIQLTVNGGVPPYRYKINNGSYQNLPANNDIIGTNFIAGTYNITVIDMANCTTTAGAVQVKATNGLVMNLSQLIPAQCDTNGTFRISLSNGTPIYSYRINGQGWVSMTETTDTISIASGLHKVYVKDANGCEISDTVRILNTTDLSMQVIQIFNAPCKGLGSVYLNINGSTLPLTYSIDGGKTQKPATSGAFIISNLFEGTYQVLLTDGNGCTTSLNGIEIGRDIDFIQAADDRVYTYVTQSVSGYLLYDDYESNRYGFAINNNSVPANGSISIEATGAFTYTPNANFIGRDSIQYTITNSCGFNSSAWLYINVLKMDTVNRLPIAMDDDYSIKIGTSLLNFEVRSNDVDPDGDGLSNPIIVSNVLNGTLVSNGNGTFNYTPNANFMGIDAFAYQVCDPQDSCSVAQVHITVLSDNIFTNTITALPDAYWVEKYDTLKVLNILDGILKNDKYPQGSTPQITILDSTNNGVLTIDSVEGTFAYLPNLHFSGSDDFKYLLCNNTGVDCDTAWVNIFVVEQPCPLPVTLVVEDTLTICQRDSVNLNTAILPASVNIDTALFYEDSQFQVPVINNYVKTQKYYYIKANNIYQCSAYDSVYLQVIPHPLVNLLSKTVTICSGDSVNLTVDTTHATGILWHSFNSVAGTATGETTKTLHYVSNVRTSDTTVNIYVTVYGNSPCVTTEDTVTLTLYAKPELAFADTASCQPVNLTTLAATSGSTAGLTKQYYDSNFQPVPDPSAVGTGKYYIIGVNSTFCKDTATVNIIVTGPLNGDYTVSNTDINADFATLKQAADRYNTCGISANSKLIISSDLIELETVEFKGTAPGSETWILTIVSNGIKRLVKFKNE